MAYTWEELHKMTVKKLREIAEEQGDHTELHGFLTMHKESADPGAQGRAGRGARRKGFRGTQTGSPEDPPPETETAQGDGLSFIPR